MLIGVNLLQAGHKTIEVVEISFEALLKFPETSRNQILSLSYTVSSY